jgi:hypothetical protein
MEYTPVEPQGHIITSDPYFTLMANDDGEGCLEENAEAKIETIQQRARSVGQTISTGSISRYRKQYFEAHQVVSTSRLKVVETRGTETRGETETEIETAVEAESESLAVGE